MKTLSLNKSLTGLVQWTAAVAAGALFLTGETSAFVGGIFAAFLLIGILISRRRAASSVKQEKDIGFVAFLARALGPALGVSAFSFGVFDFLTLSKSFLVAMAHFLLLVQAVRLLSLKSARDKTGSLLLSSLMMLSASTLSLEWTFMAMLLIFLPSLILALILLIMAVDFDAVEKLAPLQKERDGFFLAAFWRPLVLSTALAFFVCVAFGSVLFLIFPRVSFQGFRANFLQPVRKSAFTNEVRLDQAGTILEDDTVAMRVEVPKNLRAAYSGYLRGDALDKFENGRWTRSNEKPLQVFYGVRKGTVFPWAEGDRGPVLQQTIYLESMDSASLFGMPPVRRLFLDRPFLFVGADQTVRRLPGDLWRLRYVTGARMAPAGGGLYALGERGEGNPRFQRKGSNSSEPLLDTPTRASKAIPSFLNGAKGDALLSSIIKSEADAFKKAALVEAFFQQKFSYSLRASTGAPSLEAFLFETRVGHCELFASGMALLLRKVGLATRLVSGFHSREWNDRGHYFVVRLRHAHAWVEVSIPGRGWVAFDPTPVVSFESTPSSLIPAWWSENLDALNLAWNRAILSYDLDKQISLLLTLTRHSHRFSHGFFSHHHASWTFRDIFQPKNWKLAAPSLNKGAHAIGPILFFSLLSLIAVGVWFYLHKAKDNRSWVERTMMAFLRQAGIDPSISTTFQEAFERYLKNHPGQEPPVRALLSSYHRYRFKERPNVSLTHAQKTEFLSQLNQLKKPISC